MQATTKNLQQERYRIIHQFGQDETGMVYEAYDNVLKTSVMLKESSAAKARQAHKADFADEAKLLTEIKHESILQINDYFSETDNHYLVMELVDGENLGELLEKNQKPFEVSEVTEWADQLLDALNYLHRFAPPVIHLNIKPQNIKLTQDGKIKLLNFADAANVNVSKAAATLADNSPEAAALHYLPLEQIWEGLDPASQKVILNSYNERSVKILEQPADARSDIYALGATLYHLLTGQLPVDALARSIEILDGKNDPLVSPKELNPSVPQEISDAVMRALEIKREKRFDSAVIMRQVLRTAQVRIKEREAEAAKAPTAVPAQEAKAAEQQKLEQEQKLAEQKRLEVEAEQKRLDEEERQRQAESAAARQREEEAEKQREAEAQKLAAEQKAAAEAEELLLAKETEAAPINKPFDSKEVELPVFAKEKPSDKKEKSAKEKSVAETSSDGTKSWADLAEKESSAKPSAAKNESSAVETSLFEEEPKNNKSMMLMIAGAVAFIVIIGAAWGIWSSMSSKPASPTPSVANTSSSNSADTSAPAAAPNSVTTPETTVPVTVPSSEETENVANPSAVKKAAAPQATPQVKKTATPQAKPTAAPKKAVTVDDLINDN